MRYEPSPWGQEYHSLRCDEALGGGSAGPGKSMVLVNDSNEQIVVQHARCAAGEFGWGKAPGWTLHLRREFPRLEETIHRSKMLFPALDPGVKWHHDSHKWVFSSGYQYSFGHLKDTDSYLNYRSKQYTKLKIDEAGEIEHADIYHELAARVRTSDPVLAKMLGVRCMSNPTPNWLREYFVDPAPQGRKILRKRIGLADGSHGYRTRIFLPARLSDNPDPAFRAQYELNLRDKPAHIRAALLDGDWYVVAGAFFADLWDPARVVIKPFRIPENCRRFRSGDWGYKEPCVILWWAVLPDRELICYRERTYNGKGQPKMDAHEVAQAIKETEKSAGEWNKLKDCSRLSGPMDTQLWEERGHRGPTMADDMARVGVYWVKATKGRKQAAQLMIRRLGERGYNDRPGVMFLETCTKSIQTIPAIGTDPVDPEKPADGGPDHWWAATAYALSYNASPANQNAGAIDPDEEEDEAPRSRRASYGS